MPTCKQILDNFAGKNGDKFTGLHILGRFSLEGRESICKLWSELVVSTALFACIRVVRAKILSFFFDYGVKL